LLIEDRLRLAPLASLGADNGVGSNARPAGGKLTRFCSALTSCRTRKGRLIVIISKYADTEQKSGLELTASKIYHQKVITVSHVIGGGSLEHLNGRSKAVV
jgi:hypothetical protein